MVSLSRQLALASVTGLALLCLCSPVWATDGTVRNLRYDPANRHFVIDATGPIKAMVNTLNIAGHKRVIIDLDNAEIGIDLPRDVQLLQALNQQLPSLRNVTVNQYGGNGRPIVRILLDMQGDPGTIRLVRNQGPQIELELNETATRTAMHPNFSSPNPATRRTDLPPSLSGLSHSSHQGDDSVSKELYNRSLQTQQDQKRQIETLQREVAQLNRQIEQGSTSSLNVDDLKRSLSTLNQKYEALLQDNQYLKSQLDNASQAKSTTSSLQNELNRLKAENQSLQVKIQQAQAPVKSQGPGLEDLKRTVETLNRQHEQLRAENRSLQSRIEQLSAVGNKTQEASELRRSLSALQIQLDNLTQERQQLSQENNRLKSQLSTNSGKSTVSDVDLQKLRGQLTIAQQSLNDSIRTINEQNKEIAYLRNQVSDVKAGLDASSREQIARLQSSLDEKDETIRDLQRQLVAKMSTGQGGATLQADLDMLKRQLDKTTQQHQEDLRSLNEQLRQKNAQLQAVQNEAELASDLRRENSELKNQLASANRKVTEGQTNRVPSSELQSRDNRIAELQRQLASAQSELNSLKANKDSTSKASTSLREAMDRLTRENRELHSTVDSLKTAKQQSSGNSEQLRQLQNQVASLQSDLSDMTEKYNDSVQEANKAKQDLIFYQRSNNKTAANPELEKQVAELNRQLAEARKENTSLRESASSKIARTSTPTNAEAERDYQEGKAALAAKDINKALDKLKEAYLLDSDNSRYATDYSLALAEDHQYAEAIDTLRRYLQKNPGDRDVYNQLGKLYLLNDDANAANQAFTRALPISTLNNYATSLKKLGRMQDAENVFKLALSINPKDSEVLFNLGNLYNSENKLEQARNKYLEAIQLKPDFAEAHYNLGLIFSKLGDNTKAVTHLEKFLQLSPNARNAETIRAYVQKLKA